MAKRKAKPKSPEPSTDEQALLAAVIAHPDEDTPRLMYADWLQENGQADRAEFIRSQIEAGRFPPGVPEAKKLRARVVALAKKHRKRWSKDSGTLQLAFVRGFGAAGKVHDLGGFCDIAEEVFARFPLRVLYAEYVYEEGWAKVVDCPHFARLTGLGSTSRGWGSTSTLHVLAADLANLKALDFHNGDYNGTEVACEIAEAKHLTKLLVLDLTGNNIGDEGLEALAGAKHLASLQALRLGEDAGDSANSITADGMQALARSKSLTSLTQLILDGNDLGSGGVAHLLTAKWLPQLTELDVSFNVMSEGTLLAIANSRHLVNLRRLAVLSGQLTDRVARAFVQSKFFPKLTELQLFSGADSELPSKTREALVERFGASLLGLDNFVPSRVCWEDKVAWRMKMLPYDPPAPEEDCEVV